MYEYGRTCSAFNSVALHNSSRSNGAAMNEACLRQISFFFRYIFSHMIDDVGKHFEFGVLNTFCRYWTTM